MKVLKGNVFVNIQKRYTQLTRWEIFQKRTIYNKNKGNKK